MGTQGSAPIALSLPPKCSLIVITYTLMNIMPWIFRLDTLKRHLPVQGQEGLNELRKIAVRFEEKTYAIATSQVIRKCWYSIVWVFADTIFAVQLYCHITAG